MSFDGTANISLNNNAITNGAGYITATLTEEQVEDYVGGMVTGNTETGITVTYQDADGTLDFVVASQTDNNFTTTLKNKLDGIAAGATNVSNTNQLTNGAGFITATLTEEQVEDYVGGMVTGNTETGITVTYQDADGTLDFVVASQTDNNFTTTLKNKLDGIAASATNVTNNNQLTNGASYITASNAAITNKLPLAGGTLTGNLIVEDSVLRVGDTSGDNYTEIKHLTSDSYGFDYQHDNASAILNEQGTTNQALVLGDVNADASSVLFGVSVKQVGVASDAYVPKLTLTGAGALTLTSTCTATTFSGSGASLTSLNGSEIDSGTVATARLGSGTANSSSYLRGDGSWATISAGAEDGIFWENDQAVSSNYTITNGKNAMSAGPITINSGVTVTVGSGENWTIV